MKNEEKNQTNKKKILTYYSFINQSNANNIDETKDNQNLSIDNNFYLNIDAKNILEERSKKDLAIVNKRIKDFEDMLSNADEEISKQNLTKQIIKKFLDKLYPKCEASVKKISLLISREIRSGKKLNKEAIEGYINYFYSLRHDLKYSKALKFTKEIFRSLGYVLCYIYGKFTYFSTKEAGGIKECIKKVMEKKIDVLTDFFLYCDENKKDPIQIKKTEVWKILRKKYDIPPELIFLINMFHRMNALDIGIEFNGEILNEDDIKLFTITILNINYILPKLEHINLNFIHNKLQFSLYKRYYRKINNLLKLWEENIKKNKIKNHSKIYNIKWDFEHDFNLEEYRKNDSDKLY